MKDNYIINIGLLTCIWKRPNLTNIVFQYYKKLKAELWPYGINLELVAVGSENNTSRSLANINNFDYIEAANSPLGAKWNKGLSVLQKKSIDAVVIVGSDDLLNKEIFLLYKESLLSGALYVGFTQLYFYDLKNDKMLFWKGYKDGRKLKTIGLGRCIDKSYVEMCNWKLWSDNIDCGLDKDMTERFSAEPYFNNNTNRHLRLKCDSNPFFPIDIKADVNMWSFAQVKNTSTHVEFDSNDFFSKNYSETIDNHLKKLRNRLVNNSSF